VMPQRIELPGLLDGIEGTVGARDATRMVNPCFDHDGTLYILSRRRAGVWHVVKLADDGDAAAEYNVVVESRSVSCDCPAGRMHRACRHKEMVKALMLEEGEV